MHVAPVCELGEESKQVVQDWNIWPNSWADPSSPWLQKYHAEGIVCIALFFLPYLASARGKIQVLVKVKILPYNTLTSSVDRLNEDNWTTIFPGEWKKAENDGKNIGSEIFRPN